MYSGQQVATKTINHLPIDVKKIIASFLTNHDPLQASQDILKLRKLSKEWNYIVMSYLSYLWKKKVEEGWIDEFLKPEKNPVFKQMVLKSYETCQNLNLKALILERDKATLSAPSPIEGFRQSAITHLVIRKKIEILAKLMANSGIEVPDSLQNFPPLTGTSKHNSAPCRLL